MSDGIVVSRIDGAMHIRMDRAAKRNALNRTMYEAMAGALAEAEEDASIRAVLFSGEGGTFCGGNDMNDFVAHTPHEADRPAFGFIQALCDASKVLVAAVQGPAVGIGSTMLLHCDLVVAGHSALLSMPFIKLGLVPEAASSLLLPRAVGHRRAAEMLLLGEPVDAQTALRWGLVNQVVDDAVLLDAALGLVARVISRPATALLMTKRLLRGDPASLAQRVREEGVMFSSQLQSPEFQQAASAFLNKEKSGPGS